MIGFLYNIFFPIKFNTLNVEELLFILEKETHTGSDIHQTEKIF